MTVAGQLLSLERTCVTVSDDSGGTEELGMIVENHVKELPRDASFCEFTL
jgi:hypothetical protein